MVGVPKSTGCKICRTRKIKCDETWPFCLNCRKNGKECPGRPDRHTFRDVRAGQNRSPVWPSDTLVPGSVIEYDQPRTLKPLDERIRSNGSATHRFRITGPGGLTRSRKPGGRSKSTSSSPPKSPFLTQPSPSPQFQLARALIAATSTGSPGQRMSVFGPFIEEVPARIGHNAALDAAVAVLVNAHTSLVHKKMANEIVSPQLYLKAIMALQSSLEDPRQGRSANTLCATVLLGLVEALAGPRTGNRYLAHVGGAGRLMELQGPGQYHDKFAKEILRFSRGGIIVTAIYERRKCFLSLPDWKDIAFDKTGLGFDDCLNTDLIQHMSELPGILKDLKELTNQYTYQPLENVYNYNLDPNIDDRRSERCPSLEFSPASFDDPDLFTDLTIPPSVSPYPVSTSIYPHSPARSAVLKKIVTLRESLTALGVHMKARLCNRNTVVELPAIEPNSPVPTAYHFTTWRDITSYSCFWSMVIMTNKVMMKLLPPYDPLNFELQAECRATALEICKTWEDAWATKPIGSFHTGLSFVVAYEFCVPEVQEWIIRSLNSLLDYQMVDAFRWSHEIIEMMSGKLTGEGPDLVFSTMNMSKEVV